jgi:hypothetical protein
VELLSSLRADLTGWRLASGRPPSSALIFPGRDGRPWDDGRYRRWRRGTFKPACEAAGLGSLHPYALRHSFVSLLIAEGRPILQVAEQAGHAPSVALDTYGHVVAIGPGSAEDAIAETRRDTPVPATNPSPRNRRRRSPRTRFRVGVRHPAKRRFQHHDDNVGWNAADPSQAKRHEGKTRFPKRQR